ncbi:MAG: Hsp20/alpha crystallin family protein [Chloroflexi bacterium]|jgi:HSP20 family protein|nr:Hsp20/alpha crystallin family protein [Chloroflexota bacterium]
MAIARWDPFAEMMSLREAMNRLFEESFVRPTSLVSWTRAAGVPIDVYTEGDNYVIEAAVPGLAPDALDISVLGNEVTIRGEYPTAPESRRYLLRERPFGQFERRVTLPDPVDAEHVQAHCEHGLLRLTVPKAESARPRRIALTAGR